MATKEAEKKRQASPTQEKKVASWADTVKEASSVILIVTGVLYVTGMFVAGIGTYWQSNQLVFLPLARVRYIVVGLGALLYVMVGGLPLLLLPMLKWLQEQHKFPRVIRVGVGGIILFSVVTLVFLWFCGLGDYTTLHPNMQLLGCQYPLLLLLLSAAIASSNKPQHRADRKCVWMVFGSFCVLGILLYSLVVYPLIAQPAGGGRPSKVRLSLAVDSKPPTYPSYVSVGKDGWTQTLLLLGWTDDYCLIQIPIGNTNMHILTPGDIMRPEDRLLAIKKDEIRCIEYLQTDR